MLYPFINFACSLVEVISFYLIMTASFERSVRSTAADSLMVLSAGIFYGFFNDQDMAPTGAILGILAEFIWTKFCLKGKLSHKCFGILLCYLLLLPIDWATMVMASCFHIAGSTPITEAVLNYPSLRVSLMIISKFLLMTMTMAYVTYCRYRKWETILISRFLFFLTGVFAITVWILLSALCYFRAIYLSIPEWYYRWILVIPIILAILYICVLLLSFLLNRANMAAYRYERILQRDRLEQRHYENMQILERELQDWKSDTRQQLQILQHQISSGSGRTFLWQDTIMQSLIQGKDLLLTGNTVFDSIISQTIKQAREHGISFQTNIQQIDALVMEETDIVCLMSNLLDNACEAVEKLDPERRKIYLEMRCHRGCLLIKTENTCLEPVIDSGNHLHTTKSNSKLHGYGINCMKSIVEKYQGMLQYHADHNIFTMKIVLKGDSIHENIRQ